MRLAVQTEINLCKYCLAREGIRARISTSCDLCGGLLGRIGSSAGEIIEKLSEYEYETFLIGVSIPQSVLDQEDELRSRLKIKGKESVKSQITGMLTAKIAKSTGKRPDYSRPDITVLLSLSDGSVSISPRSVWISARYEKSTRGISQRDSKCQTCNGLGCAECDYRGRSGESVESIATAFFTSKFLAESCNFVWLGSEDENSLVQGSGRPFYVEVLRPKKRLSGKTPNKFRSSLSFKSKDIRISKVERLEKRITEVPQFDVRCRVYLSRNEVSQYETQLEEIKRNFTEAIINVRLSRKNRVVHRVIHSISPKQSDRNDLELLIDCEGGIPIKKLITGQDNSVEPNLSNLILGYAIDPEKPFDILDVKTRRPNPNRRVREHPENPVEELSEDA